MITIFDEPTIASPSLLSDLEKADAQRNAHARLIADDAVAGRPLEPYYARGYAEHTACHERLVAALTERIRRNDAKRDQDAAMATYEVPATKSFMDVGEAFVAEARKVTRS